MIKDFVDEESMKLVELVGEIDDQFDLEEKIKNIQNTVFKKIPNGDRKVKFLMRVYNSAISPVEKKTITIYREEAEFIRGFEQDIAKKFFCLIVWEKLHPHDSRWIRFDFEGILRILYSGKEIESIKKDEFSYLCESGLDFRVVGSKEAIPCYKVPEIDCAEIFVEYEESAENNLSVFNEIMLL